jgi:hypothetical protein
MSLAKALAQRLQHPRAPYFLIALGLFLTLPSFAYGFYTDDFVLLAKLRGIWIVHSAPWDLYRFAPPPEAGDLGRQMGLLPWWTSLHISLRFFRPLTSLLFWLDYNVFGLHPAGYHIHTLLWLAAFFYGAYRIYNKLLSPKIAIFALLLLVLDNAHSFPAAWLACRHMLIAAAPCFFGLGAHIAYRREGFSAGRYLGPLGLIVGLFASESAMAGVCYWVAFELTASGTRRERITGAAPALAIAFVYLVAYKVTGYGTIASGAYVNPFVDPLAFALATAERLPTLIGDSISTVPSDLFVVFSHVPYIVLGLLSTAALGLLYRAVCASMTAEERRTLAFFAIGAVLSIVVHLGGFIGTRLLLFTSVGASAVFATLIVKALEQAGPVASRAARRGAYVLAVLHLCFSPLFSLMAHVSSIDLGSKTNAIADTLNLPPGRANKVILLSGSDPMATVYAGAVYLFQHPTAVDGFHMLSMAHADHRITRLGPQSFRVEPLESGFLRNTFETLFRAPSEPFHVGDEFKANFGTVRVADMKDGLPTVIDVHLDVSVDDEHLVLLQWEDSALRRVQLPPIGESRTVRWSPGPTKIF